jgi:hypothetical protein
LITVRTQEERTVTSLQIDRQAQDIGFRLRGVEVDGVIVWQWRRGRRRSPPFLNVEAARSWMAEALRTASLFDD